MRELKFTKEERNKYPYRSLACAIIWRGMRDRQEKDMTRDSEPHITPMWYQIARGIPATADSVSPDAPEPIEDTDAEWMLAQKLPCEESTKYKWSREDRITLRRMKVADSRSRTFVKVDDRLRRTLKRYQDHGS